MIYNLIIIKVISRNILMKFKCIAKQKRLYLAALSLFALKPSRITLIKGHRRDVVNDLHAKMRGVAS